MMRRSVRTTLRVTTLLLVVMLLRPAPAHTDAVAAPCNSSVDDAEVSATLARIRASADPCGESPEVVAVLDKLQRCRPAKYQICTDRLTDKNTFDRPTGRRGEYLPRTITWNPTLRTELESGCDADPWGAVRRDPAASLLHELVHAVQDCDGLDPSEHEFDAVRIENIYRRAAGLCQRTRYGDDPLPAQMVVECVPGHCLCARPTEAAGALMVKTQPLPSGPQSGTAAGDAHATLGAAR